MTLAPARRAGASGRRRSRGSPPGPCPRGSALHRAHLAARGPWWFGQRRRRTLRPARPARHLLPGHRPAERPARAASVPCSAARSAVPGDARRRTSWSPRCAGTAARGTWPTCRWPGAGSLRRHPRARDDGAVCRAAGVGAGPRLGGSRREWPTGRGSPPVTAARWRSSATRVPGTGPSTPHRCRPATSPAPRRSWSTPRRADLTVVRPPRTRATRAEAPGPPRHRRPVVPDPDGRLLALVLQDAHRPGVEEQLRAHPWLLAQEDATRGRAGSARGRPGRRRPGHGLDAPAPRRATRGRPPPRRSRRGSARPRRRARRRSSRSRRCSRICGVVRPFVAAVVPLERGRRPARAQAGELGRAPGPLQGRREREDEVVAGEQPTGGDGQLLAVRREGQVGAAGVLAGP